MPYKGWAYDLPFELAVAAPERGHRQRGDTRLLVVRFEIVESVHDVTQARYRAPVVLGGEVDYPAIESLIKVGLAECDLLPVTAGNIIFKHVGVMALELQCDALAHDTD